MTARWGVRYGSWWMVQYSLDWTVSLGVHLDPLFRLSDTGPYGPYLDVHLGPAVVSVGRHPARANSLVALLGQGSLMRPDR